ncbi:AI-2E family transporter [Apibacter sp. B3889]|uniref:AI-2E family transporter n=1 Tax=unclassified Apibacter TaxID=2630820 RepID=UPI00132A1DAD|nr:MULTISPECIES: AI-2E family transporter [unclassified Apibacter]MXO33644.1 AI-2E family transporter [Apibacter sp. B3883]MXO41001.1 AI-2E family transporter [Apibacter sp. B3889]MXP04170.1 AI-2E family transporter [Apibacter sp. B3887]MXP07019.1 AI-2E family transporter [Apibacter sp. B3935]
MNYKDISKGIISAVSVIALTVLLFFLLWKIRFVLGYIFVAFAFSLMGRPLMNFLSEKVRISNTISACITLLIMVGTLLTFLSFVIPLAIEQAGNLSLLDTDKLQNSITEQVKLIDEALRSKHIYLFEDNYAQLFTSKFNFKIHMDTLQSGFSLLAELGISIFSVTFITFFFLREKDLFNRMIIGAAPTNDIKKVIQVLSNIKDLLTRYFLGLCLQICSMFLLYLAILGGFNIKDMVIIAMFCAFCNLIPYLGPLLGFFIINLLSMSSMFSLGMDFNTQIIPTIFWISILYLIAQLIDNAIFQPLIYAKSVKSHPLEIFLVMLIFGILFGAIGVTFAIPGYTVLRVVMKSFFNRFKIVQAITKNL